MHAAAQARVRTLAIERCNSCSSIARERQNLSSRSSSSARCAQSGASADRSPAALLVAVCQCMCVEHSDALSVRVKQSVISNSGRCKRGRDRERVCSLSHRPHHFCDVLAPPRPPPPHPLRPLGGPWRRPCSPSPSGRPTRCTRRWDHSDLSGGARREAGWTERQEKCETGCPQTSAGCTWPSLTHH